MGNIVTSELSAIATSTAPRPAGRWTIEHVLEVCHWTSKLRSIRVSRPAGFIFKPGHYARLGLDDGDGGAIWRPFSMVSAPDEECIEFTMVLVPGGPFSEKLRHLTVGSPILVEKFGLGFLTLDQLAAGHDLWLLASGTGIGPFISLLRDAATWNRFDRLVVVHSVRTANELAYRGEIAGLAAMAHKPEHLRYLPVITRETHPWALHERIPKLVSSGELEKHTGIVLDPPHSRVMVCGNPDLTREMRALLATRGFEPSRRGVPGQMAFEKYW